ncbi:MAG: flagellar hook-associated protein FlgK, partial [Rhodocyclaceae bacterium]|nr:flagellar hook-associated protein FlgK [Rhodocyclaceae bacterium]
YGLATMQSGEDASRMTVGITLASGGTAALPEAMLSGGTLGGLLAFRRESLDTAQNALGRIALGLAETFNAQHRLGQDLTGALGGNFFTAPVPQVLTPNNPANPAPITAPGTVSVAVGSASALTASDYRLTYNGGGNYTLLRLSDNTTLVNNAALPATVDGLAISVAGEPGNGASFLIQPTRAAAHDIAVALTDARSIAAAAPIRTAASNGNSGTGAISAGSVTSTTGLPLAASPGGDITLTFDSSLNQFTVTGGPGGTLAYNPAAEGTGKTFSFPTVGGFTFTVAGAPGDGDVFTISANSAGVADNRNALLLAGLQTGKTLAGGTASYQSAYAQIVSDVGNKTREIQVTATAQESVVKQAEEAQQSLSGVNLDEEAANLLRYQQAYQASGKMIEIADKLFNTLLELGR